MEASRYADSRPYIEVDVTYAIAIAFVREDRVDAVALLRRQFDISVLSGKTAALALLAAPDRAVLALATTKPVLFTPLASPQALFALPAPHLPLLVFAAAHAAFFVLAAAHPMLVALTLPDALLIALASPHSMVVALTLPHALLFVLASPHPVLVAFTLPAALLFALASPYPLLSLGMAGARSFARSFVAARLPGPVFTAFATHAAHRLAMSRLTLGLSMGPRATGAAATAHSLRRSNAHASGERGRSTRRQKRIPDGVPHS
jgi:hypothetical protein